MEGVIGNPHRFARLRRARAKRSGASRREEKVSVARSGGHAVYRGHIGAHALRVVYRLHLQKPERRHLEVPAKSSRHPEGQVQLACEEPPHSAALYAEAPR